MRNIDSQSDFIKVVFEYEQRQQDYPNSKYLQENLNLSKSRVSEIAKKLRKLGYLASNTRQFKLTAEAYDWIKGYSPLMSPAYLPLLGEVRAGESDSDVLAVYAEDIHADSIQRIPIPGEITDAKVFLLRVVGDSMEQVNIFEGDYVVVREFKDTESPRQNELIVTKYLDLAYQDLLKDGEIEIQNISDDEYRGPVIKHYSRREETRNGKPYLIHGLGWFSKTRGSDVSIKAIDIRPMGKVCGVYREITD